MKKNKKIKTKKVDIKEALKDVDKTAFDGHTDFQKLSPRQKLEWLSELIYFKSQVKKK